jgi:hypothetical protein
MSKFNYFILFNLFRERKNDITKFLKIFEWVHQKSDLLENDKEDKQS